ncbi:MAG TPA: hypothetical protein PLG05_08005 [Bacteroidales bacterium]|nr:hypothetical protein [Bacteroidales bacterium]HOR60615.1 hypothetical protein [Bacteroidales bacterium]HPL05106.1 hypothetical protein [Bacteroidales bacterium]
MNKKITKNQNRTNITHLKEYLILIALSFLLYGLSINNDFNIDDDYVYENHELVQKGIKGIPEIFSSRYNTKDEQYFGYRPLTIAIFAIEYQFFGSNPHSAHFFNILYYAIACALLFYFLNLIFKEKYPDNYSFLSFLIVLLFATHAIHTEVVLSLKNREEIISFIFGMVASICAIKYFENRKIYHLLLSIFSLVLAFLAKESAIVFIVLIPLTIIFFKTEIKILPNYKYTSNIFSPNTKHNKIIIYTFLVFIFLFLLLSPEFKITANKSIQLHNLYININEYVVWGIFFICYLYLLYYRYKINCPVKFNTNNILLWTANVIVLVFLLFTKSTFAGLLMFFIPLLTLIIKDKEEFAPKSKVKIFDGLSKKLIFSTLAFLLITGVVLFITYYIPKKSLPEVNAPVFMWQNPIFGFGASIFDKMALALYSLIYYFKLLLIPYPLRFYYGYKMIPIVGISNPIVLISLVINIVLLIWAMKNFNKRNVMSFGYLFLFISLFPLANTFFPLTGIIAERLLFTPSVGFSIILSFLLLKITKTNLNISLKKADKNLIFALALVFILPHSVITINRNKDWKDRLSLFSHDIKYLENSAKANNVYANILISEVYAAIKNKQNINHLSNQIKVAEAHFKKAIEIDSTYSNPWHNLAYMNMIIYKNYELAEQQFTKCIQADSTIAAVYLNRGIVNYHLNNYEQSIQDLNVYISKYHNYKDKEWDKAYLFMGKSYLELKDTTKCNEYYIKALDNIKVENLSLTVLFDIINNFAVTQDYENILKTSEYLKNENLNAKGLFDMITYYANIKDYNYIIKLIEFYNKPNSNSTSLNDIIKHFETSKDYENIIKTIDFKIYLNPELDANYVDKGNYYLLSGNTAKAIENWEIAFEKNKANFNIAMTLSNYFKENNNLEKANYYYSEANKFKIMKSQ